MTDSEREVPGLPTTLQQPVLRSRRCPRTVKRHDRKQLQRTCTQHDVEHRHEEMHYDKQQEYKNTFSYQKPTKQTHRTARQCNFVVCRIKNETAVTCEHNSVTVLVSHKRKSKAKRPAFHHGHSRKEERV